MCGACVIRSGEMCISMDKNILFRMDGDIGKETGGGPFLKSIYGRSAVFQEAP